MSNTRHPKLANVLMLVTTLCWAGNPVACKIALLGFQSFALAQLRALAAAALLLLFLAARLGRSGLSRSVARWRRRHWVLLVFAGLTGITLNQLFFVAGLARTSALHAGLIAALGPVIVLAVSVAGRREHLTVPKLGGIAAALTGVILIVSHETAVVHGSWIGDLVVVGSTAAFALYTVLQKEISAWGDDATLNGLIFAVGALLMLPLGGYAVSNTRWADVPVQSWFALVYMVLFGSVISYVIYAFALKHLPATRVAAFSYLQPVLTSTAAVWLVHDRVAAAEVIGGLLILGGMYFTGEPQKESRPLAQRAA
jgi:drug/metabolite transporter (DMT)-like permease